MKRGEVRGTDGRIRETAQFCILVPGTRRAANPPGRGRAAASPVPPSRWPSARRAVGALAAIGGITASLAWGTPAGPSIVLVATAVFAVGLVVGGRV